MKALSQPYDDLNAKCPEQAFFLTSRKIAFLKLLARSESERPWLNTDNANGGETGIARHSLSRQILGHASNQ
jgi:hypothetical protein